MSSTLTSAPETIDRLTDSVYPAFAMLAGMQLDLFTPLGGGPMSAAQFGDALGGGVAMLRGAALRPGGRKSADGGRRPL